MTIIHRRDALRAGAILQSRALSNPKIQFIWNTVVAEIKGEKAVESLVLKNVQTGEETNYPTDGIFIFIGNKPNTEIYRGQLEMDERGYVLANQLMETSVPGVFAAGEVSDAIFRQVITSAGMGAAAAIQAGRFLEHMEG